MNEYIALSLFCIMVGWLIGKSVERAVWVWRTHHLDICEHATPRCHQCNLRRADHAEK